MSTLTLCMRAILLLFSKDSFTFGVKGDEVQIFSGGGIPIRSAIRTNSGSESAPSLRMS